MNVFEQFKQSKSFDELSKNIRLQWMLVGIIIISSLSVTKALYDNLLADKISLEQQMNMLSRLQTTASQPIDEKLIISTQESFETQLTQIPNATSSSTAEAKGLTEIEDLLEPLMKRKRVNLLGSENSKAGDVQFWSVRIDITGILSPKDFIVFLSHFDQSQKKRRITSMRYSPKTSNSLSIVIDLLYKSKPNNE